ncbi:MAG TPA: chemotaxis protein CheX [Burkholderiales bacterium]|nr:chemotaxis protein CheX [Burkholderiales bacterium]
MDEERLQVFIDGVTRYFKQVTHRAAEVGTPYLAEGADKVAYDYTGIIGISGIRKGCVYFTAPTLMLKSLLLALGETDTSAENQADLVGEVANTISGNARRSFGSEFVISTPTIVPGSLGQTALPHETRSFVIPITWQKHQSGLVITLQ